MCRDLRNRKRLFALGMHEKNKSKFSAAPAASSSSFPPSLPPHRGLPFPAQPCCLTLSSLPSCQGPPRAGREQGDQLAQHLHPTAHRALARTRRGAGAPELPGRWGVGSRVATRIPGARLSQEDAWAGRPDRERALEGRQQVTVQSWSEPEQPFGD